jgi:iron-sulfur cluster repair protein YtfE (RIC family)
MIETTISAYYTGDHDRLDGLFAQFRSSKTNDPAGARATFEEFKAGLERHIDWEEDILFPVFEAHTGMHDTGPTAVMREEHRLIRQFLDTIGRKLQRGDLATDEDEARLLTILKEHNSKEELILYPAIDRQVSVRERDDVFVRMGQG